MNKNILLNQIDEILYTNRNSKYYLITALSNISSLLFHIMEDTNWLGFYINEDNNLVLGPFQGKVACTYIPYGKGVCGKCLSSKKAIMVSNVHEFEGHIACDCASNSELVIPILKNNEVKLILDIDSPILNRFSKEDQEILTLVCEKISSVLK